MSPGGGRGMCPCRGTRGMHPPFFFVLPKKNAPCTVEEKGAGRDLCSSFSHRKRFAGLRREPWASLLPGALNIESSLKVCRRKGQPWVVIGVQNRKASACWPRAFRLRYALPGWLMWPSLSAQVCA